MALGNFSKKFIFLPGTMVVVCFTLETISNNYSLKEQGLSYSQYLQCLQHCWVHSGWERNLAF